MDSLEYKKLLVAFGEGLMRLTEQLESAVDGELSKGDVRASVAAARSKLAQYEEFLSRFGEDTGKRQDFEKQFTKRLSEIRESLTQLE